MNTAYQWAIEWGLLEIDLAALALLSWGLCIVCIKSPHQRSPFIKPESGRFMEEEIEINVWIGLLISMWGVKGDMEEKTQGSLE